MQRPKILLVNPWIYDFAAYDMWAKPLGLLVTATRLRENGWEPYLVDFLDPDHPGMPQSRKEGRSHGKFHRAPVPKPAQLEHVQRQYCRYGVLPEMLINDIQSLPKPDAVVVTSLMTYWYIGVRESISLVRKVLPDVPILLGGIYASLMPQHAAAASGADEVIVGPGERFLFPALEKTTGIRTASADDSLEFSPALDLLRKVRFLPLPTSRGCPLRCSYCASRLIAPWFVRRSPEAVLLEIESALNRYGVSDIALYDDAFLWDADNHAHPILERAAQAYGGIRWHSPNGLHASMIGEKTAWLMKAAGFETIRIGLESTSDEFHGQTGRKTDFGIFFQAVQRLREAGFERRQIGAYLLVGLPGQSRTQIADDVDAVLSAGAFPKLAEYSPIPGTSTWLDAVKSSRYPIADEPLFHNCTLLPAATPEVDGEFIQSMRRKIGQYCSIDEKK